MTTILNAYQRARLLFFSAVLACICLFWWTSMLLRVPVNPGHESSLLQQPSPILAMLVIAVVFVGCVAIGTGICGVIRHNAGLAAACMGLSILSFRGGPMDQIIFWAWSHSGVPSIFLMLAVELLLLGSLVGICAWAIDLLYRNGTIRDRESTLSRPEEISGGSELTALGVQIGVTLAAVLILARTSDKQQALAAAALGAMAGSAAAQTFFPSAKRFWHALVPILVGCVGYVLAFFEPAGAQTGDLSGFFAPLARVTPLDYAGFGVAGAIVGDWMGRKWAREREEKHAGELAGA